ncbi:hypothetical protein D1872_235890 [compost metagenome]
MRRTVIRGRQRRVGGPSGIRRPAHNPAQVQQQTAEQEGPETERVQKRKRHVAGADLQRNDRVHQRENDRHHAEENHGCSVHRNQFVKLLGSYEIIHRFGQLNADQQRFNPADAEEQTARYQIQDSDFLVVDCRQPVHQTLVPLDTVSVSQGFVPPLEFL